MSSLSLRVAGAVPLKREESPSEQPMYTPVKSDANAMEKSVIRWVENFANMEQQLAAATCIGSIKLARDADDEDFAKTSDNIRETVDEFSKWLRNEPIKQNAEREREIVAFREAFCSAAWRIKEAESVMEGGTKGLSEVQFERAKMAITLKVAQENFHIQKSREAAVASLVRRKEREHERVRAINLSFRREDGDREDPWEIVERVNESDGLESVLGDVTDMYSVVRTRYERVKRVAKQLGSAESLFNTATASTRLQNALPDQLQLVDFPSSPTVLRSPERESALEQMAESARHKVDMLTEELDRAPRAGIYTPWGEDVLAAAQKRAARHDSTHQLGAARRQRRQAALEAMPGIAAVPQISGAMDSLFSAVQTSDGPSPPKASSLAQMTVAEPPQFSSNADVKKLSALKKATEDAEKRRALEESRRALKESQKKEKEAAVAAATSGKEENPSTVTTPSGSKDGAFSFTSGAPSIPKKKLPALLLQPKRREGQERRTYLAMPKITAQSLLLSTKSTTLKRLRM